MSGVPIGRIRPVAPVPSLITSARRLPEQVDWARGVSFVSGCADTFAWPFPCQDPQVLKDTQRDHERVDVAPFVIYTPEKCDLPVNGADIEQFATTANDVHTAAALAAALWMGAGYDDGDVSTPTLRRAATPLLTDGVLDLDDGVAALLTHYEEATGGNGGAMIHMPATLAPFALGGGAGGARVCWPEGNIYRGPLGCVVVPGPGYPLGSSLTGAGGHGPLISAGPPESYAGNAPGVTWIYVSGPVEYDVTALRALPADERDRMFARMNTYEVWSERNAIVRFDPCNVFAVEVSNPVVLLEVS